MRILRLVLLFMLLTQSCTQMNSEREINIIAAQKAKVESFLVSKDIPVDDFELLIIGYKKDRSLKVFAKPKQGSAWTAIVDYDFCTFSGDLGPKIKEGDKQIPEGFYEVDRFNPNSHFHLSLGLNYPTKRDLTIANKDDPGSDIFIHGGCHSVGCIAITDEKIEELYTLAKLSTATIHVIILPFEMTETNLVMNSQRYPKWKHFWNDLFKDWEAKNLSFYN